MQFALRLSCKRFALTVARILEQRSAFPAPSNVVRLVVIGGGEERGLTEGLSLHHEGYRVSSAVAGEAAYALIDIGE